MNLGDFRVEPAVAVSDLQRARDFFEHRLGLPEPEVEDGGLRYRCGAGSQLFVHESPATAGQANHTVARWYVLDLPTLVDDLAGRGVDVERYDTGTPTDEQGIFTADRFRAAWVKDPDGNTFAFHEYFDASADRVEPGGCPVVHVEVRGADPESLQAFYAELAGWDFSFDTPGSQVVGAVSEPGRYGFVDHIVGPDGGVPAGVGGGPGHGPYAVFYLGVPEVARAAATVERLGGQVVNGPQHAPGRDLAVALVADPEGNLVGLAGPAATEAHGAAAARATRPATTTKGRDITCTRRGKR